MPEFDYDLLILGGGGSAGFTAATTALKTGARVAMVESGRLGGLCILAGCMPSKTLLHHAAEATEAPDKRLPYSEVLARKIGVVDYLAGSREKVVAAKLEQGLVLLRGRAVFRGPHTLEVDGKAVTAEKLIIATGSAWHVPELPGLAESGYILSRDLMDLPALPESIIVLGGGAIAVELGQYLVRMGVKTSLLQRSDHLLSSENPEAGRLIAAALKRDGAGVETGCQVLSVEKSPGGKTVRFSQGGQEKSAEAKEILVALGRRPNSDGLGLGGAGVETKRGAVLVDRFMATSQPHIFAAGDVTGINMVVNLAINQGRAAGYNATHPEAMREVNDAVIPQAVFTDPQFAKVGLSARELEDRGRPFVEASYPLSGLGVSRTYPHPPEGFVAMRAEPKTGLILGAEMVAPEASLMIHDIAVALKLKGTAFDLADIPYVHPCLSEVTNMCAMKLAKKAKAG